MSRIVKKIITTNSISLVMAKGKDSWGHEYTVYIMLKNSMLAQFQKDSAEKPVDLSQYGKVLFGAFSHDVNEEVENMVLGMFKTRYLKTA